MVSGQRDDIPATGSSGSAGRDDWARSDPAHSDPAHSDPAHSDPAHSAERLLHRRRGWAWTAVGSLVASIGYLIIGISFFGGLTGALAVITLVVLFALLALVIVGLVAVVVDTVRLHLAAAVRKSVLYSVSHHPLHAHVYRYPPRHRASWFFTWFVLVLWMLLAVVYLPGLVNSVGYLAGAGPKATFVPVSHQVECARGSCSTVTNGYLKPGGTRTTWIYDVPLGKPFSVRTPVWAWGIGANLTDDTGTAVAMLIVGLFFDGIAVLIIVAAVQLWKTRAMVRRQQAAIVRQQQAAARAAVRPSTPAR